MSLDTLTETNTDEPTEDLAPSNVDGGVDGIGEMIFTARELAIIAGENPDEAGKTEDTDSEASNGLDLDSADSDSDSGVLDTKPVDSKQAAEEAKPTSPHSAAELDRAKSLGLSEEDAQAFSNSRALNLHLSLLETINSLKAPVKNDQEGSDTDGEGDVRQVSAMEGKEGEFAGLGEFINLEECEEQFTEPTMVVVRHLARVEKTLAALQQERATEQQHRQNEAIANAFDSAVDSVGDSVLGSDSEALSAEQRNSRAKLFNTVDTIVLGMQAKAKQGGKEMDPITWDELVKLAMPVAFPGKQVTKTSPSKSEALRKQSAQRRPTASSSKGSSSRAASIDSDSPQAIANSPEVMDFWERTQQANGA